MSEFVPAKIRTQRVQGFSLLEVLVALSIFAIIGLSANQMLRTVIDSREKTRTVNDQYVQLGRVVAALERDFSQFTPRTIRDQYGDPVDYLLLDDENYVVEFTRAGWRNPLGRPRSELQRVAYSLRDKTLERHFWLVLDRAEDSEPITQTLMTNVEDFQVTLIDTEGETSDSWDAPDQEDRQAPRAIEVIISTEDSGPIRRLFSLVEEVKRASAGRGDVRDPGAEENDETSGDGNNRNNTNNNRRRDPNPASNPVIR